MIFRQENVSSIITYAVLFITISLISVSCLKKDEEVLKSNPQLKSGSNQTKINETFYGHEIFTRQTGKPVTVKKKIGNEGLIRFEPIFILHILNGDGKGNLISSALIKIDGKVIFKTSDFSQKVTSLSKDVTDLTINSELEVELNGSPGSFIDLWIEGTLKPLPVLETTPISEIFETTAISGGNITSDGGTGISQRGVCWSTSEHPTIENSKKSNGTGMGSFTCKMYGLGRNTTYYLRAYATNIVGTAYGNEISFTTRASTILFNPKISYGSVNDSEGNVYKTIQIGEIGVPLQGNTLKSLHVGQQEWMVENLRVTEFNDGTPIPLVTEKAAWVNNKTPGYCWYDNNEAKFKETYGALYNGYTVNTNKLCPIGWHVPSDNEWGTLKAFLEGVEYAGGKLKEVGNIHWVSPNTGATNSSGFAALPGGVRSDGGDFKEIGLHGRWWTSSEFKTLYNDGSSSWSWYLNNNSSKIFSDYYKKIGGFSVRCVKD